MASREPISAPGGLVEAELALPVPFAAGRLGWASSALLGAAGVACRLSVVRGRTALLSLPAGLSVEGAELEAVAAALDLDHEAGLPRDRHGRPAYPAAGEPAGDPWVSDRAAALRRDLERRGVVPLRRPSWSVLVTHDIDRVTGLEPLSLAKSLAGRRDGGTMPRSSALDRRAVLRGLERMLDVERRHGVTPWFFMLAGPYGLGRYDSRYSLSWRSAREAVAAIRAAGGRFGLHGSYRAGERGSWREEAARVERAVGAPILVHRNHYLRLDPATAWNELGRAGIRYDMTVGFSDRVGFRVPIAAPYRPFDRATGRASAVVEVPMVYMDRPAHLADPWRTLRALGAAFERVRAVGGTVSVLVHPEVFAVDAGWLDFFDDMLALAVRMGARVDGELPEVPDGPGQVEQA